MQAPLRSLLSKKSLRRLSQLRVNPSPPKRMFSRVHRKCAKRKTLLSMTVSFSRLTVHSTVVTGDPSRNRENRSIHRSYDVESENPSNSSDLSSTPTLLEHASLSITQVAQLSTANLRLPTQRLFGESWTSSNPVTHPAPFDLMLSIGTGHVASTTPPPSRNDKTRRYFTLLYMPPSRPSVAPRAAGKPGSEDYQDPIQRFQHRYDGLRPVPAFQILSGGDSGSFEQLRATVKAFLARPEVASDLKLVAEELVDVRRRRAVEDPKRFRAFCGEPSGDGS